MNGMVSLLIFFGALYVGIFLLHRAWKFISGLYEKYVYEPQSKKLEDMEKARSYERLFPKLRNFFETSSRGLLRYDQKRYLPSNAIMAFEAIERGLEEMDPSLTVISPEERKIAQEFLSQFNL
jgi:hypothetical protein